MLNKQRRVIIWLRSLHAGGEGYKAEIAGKLAMKIDPNIRVFIVTDADSEEVTFFPMENVMSFSISDEKENLVQ